MTSPEALKLFKQEKELLWQALARGYCYPENETKVLDSELIKAMAKEVGFVLQTERTRTKKLVEAIKVMREEAIEEVVKIAEAQHFSVKFIQGERIEPACVPGICYCSEEKLDARGIIVKTLRKLKEQ